MGKVAQGFLCLLLQLTIIGWLPATLHALFVVHNHYEDKRSQRLIRATERAAREGRRVMGDEGQARTPFADAAVTTRSPNSSAG